MPCHPSSLALLLGRQPCYHLKAPENKKTSKIRKLGKEKQQKTPGKEFSMTIFYDHLMLTFYQWNCDGWTVGLVIHICRCPPVPQFLQTPSSSAQASWPDNVSVCEKSWLSAYQKSSSIPLLWCASLRYHPPSWSARCPVARHQGPVGLVYCHSIELLHMSCCWSRRPQRRNRWPKPQIWL